jgi:hypothetical protein
VHRQGWEDQIRFAPGLLELTRDVPMWYCRSDHEAGPDNGDSNNAYTAASIGLPAPRALRHAGRRAVDAAGLYQTWVVGRVRFILIDVRNIDRSPGANTDNSSKTMLGATQKAWLKTQLLQPEPVKVIVSDVAWMGPPTPWRSPTPGGRTARSAPRSPASSRRTACRCCSSTPTPTRSRARRRRRTPTAASPSTARRRWPTRRRPGPVDVRRVLLHQPDDDRLPAVRPGHGHRHRVADHLRFSGWDAVTGTQQVSRTDVFVSPSATGSVTLTGSVTGRAATASAGALTLGGTAFVPATAVAAGALTLSGTGAPSGRPRSAG